MSRRQATTFGITCSMRVSISLASGSLGDGDCAASGSAEAVIVIATRRCSNTGHSIVGGWPKVTTAAAGRQLARDSVVFDLATDAER